MTYEQYLNSPAWMKRRTAVMRRAQNYCERCSAKNPFVAGRRFGREPAVDVHHKTYVNIFNEPLTDLIAVCRRCHAELHNIGPAPSGRSMRGVYG